LDLNGKNDELIKELVALSTRHGIMTPYTSFLADENVSLNALTRNAVEAKDRLNQLDQTHGAGAFYQRGFKAGLQNAQAAEAAKKPVRLASGDRARQTASGGGFGGRVASGPAGPAGEAELLEESLADAEQSVQNVGNKAFYRRGKRWVDATVTDEQEKKAQRVVQFSDDYFKLAARYGRKLSQYLVFDDPVLVELDGDAYLVEPE
ncbi:MAG: VIT domain-containing protein, partial [Pirellulales bacterium]